MNSATSFPSGFHSPINRAPKGGPRWFVSRQEYNSSRPDVILAAITSKLERAASVGDIVIVDWSAAGLRKPSAIKLIVGTFAKDLLIEKLGAFVGPDLQGLRDAIGLMFNELETIPPAETP